MPHPAACSQVISRVSDVILSPLLPSPVSFSYSPQFRSVSHRESHLVAPRCRPRCPLSLAVPNICTSSILIPYAQHLAHVFIAQMTHLGAGRHFIGRNPGRQLPQILTPLESLASERKFWSKLGPQTHTAASPAVPTSRGDGRGTAPSHHAAHARQCASIIATAGREGTRHAGTSGVPRLPQRLRLINDR